MKRTIIILIALLLGINANAQTWNCGSGTPPTAAIKATLSNDTLYIRGTGIIEPYTSFGSGIAPWRSVAAQIKTVIIGEGITSLGRAPFYQLTNLTSVELPNSLKTIAIQAFYQCSSLSSVVIPASVTYIESGAFDYCTNLKDITCLATTPPVVLPNATFPTGNSFYTILMPSIKLTVPCGSREAYLNTAVWQNFGNIVEEGCPFIAGVSNVKASFSCPGQVTVTYCLNTNYPTDVTLYYSPDGGKTWFIAQTVSGDLTEQESGTGKTIVWDNRADHVQWGNFKLKVDVPKIEPVIECGMVNSSLPVGKLAFLCYNLGANPNKTIEEQMEYVSTGDADATVYGDLYQWGRPADGHEKRTSGMTATLSSTDTPPHGDFIITNVTPNDWRIPQNDTLWGATKTPNDPCPAGYRIPTKAEWESILDATSGNKWIWNTTGTPGWKVSPDNGQTYTLFFPAAGYRIRFNGVLYNADVCGYYWSSTADGSYSYEFWADKNNGMPSVSRGTARALGLCVKCVKEY